MRKRTVVTAGIVSLGVAAALGFTAATTTSYAAGNGRHSFAGSVPAWANAANRSVTPPGATTSASGSTWAGATPTPAAALASQRLHARVGELRQVPDAGAVPAAVRPGAVGRHRGPAVAEVAGFTVDYTPHEQPLRRRRGYGRAGRGGVRHHASACTRGRPGPALPGRRRCPYPATLTAVDRRRRPRRVRRPGHHARRRAAAGASSTAGRARPTGARRPSRTPPTPDGTAAAGHPRRSRRAATPAPSCRAPTASARRSPAATTARGVTVAVIDAYASPDDRADAERVLRSGTACRRSTAASSSRWSRRAPTTPAPQNPKRQDPEGWSGEETLDIEAVHTMAPGANIVYVGAPNNYRDLDAALNKVVDRHLADIVTNSYGYAGEALPPGYIKPQNDTLIQAAATGISVFFSSGDDGDETGGVAGATPTPDWPASSPWVTAVGGTSLGVDRGQHPAVRARLGDRRRSTWHQRRLGAGDPAPTCTAAAAAPAGCSPSRRYQAGVVPDSISQTYGGAADARRAGRLGARRPEHRHAGRADPDVPGRHRTTTSTASAAPASPRRCTPACSRWRCRRHGTYGLANPALYAARPARRTTSPRRRCGQRPRRRPGRLHQRRDASDGYIYTARWFDCDEPLTIHVRPGYDDVTGVGSPNGSAFLDALSY